MATQTRDKRPDRKAKPDGSDEGGRFFVARFVRQVALFVRQIVAELRKVIWPTRRELRTYTVVALVFVLVMVVIVTSLDYGFTKLVFAAFG